MKANSLRAIQIDVLRGEKTESRHVVDAVVLDSAGARQAVYGSAETETFTRSVIKPIQALAFVQSEAYRLTPEPDKAVAIACASHEAQDIHTDTIRAWLAKLNLSNGDLVCGAQAPSDLKILKKIFTSGRDPERIHNNCSGKHSAMLTACLQNGWPTSSYEAWDHPIQVEVRKHLARFTGLNMEQTAWGVDGCGLPTYRLPLWAMTQAMAAFLNPPAGYETAMKIIRAAWEKEPWMLAGHGSFDSEIFVATGGRLYTKVGAEGNYVALLFDQKRAVGIKAHDGNSRASRAALYLLLEAYGGFDPDTLSKIRALALPPIRNVAGVPVGSIRGVLPDQPRQ